MKLTQLLNRFHEKHLAENALRTYEDLAVMRAHLSLYFPDATSVTNCLKYLPPMNDKQHAKIYTAQNLPYHTRDHEWLAKYVMNCLKFVSPYIGKSPKVKYHNALQYVTQDHAFDAARNRYEQHVVRAEIQILADKIQAPQPKHVDAYRIGNSHEADETFRAAVLGKMQEFGIGQPTAEVGLEKNADLWREPTMQLAFTNRFMRPIWSKQNYAPFEQYHEILNQVAVHRDNWVALREHQYYQKHQAIIDQLGLATDNMKITPNQAFEQDVVWENHYRNLTAPLFYQANRTNDAEMER